jgi:acyl-CoA thioester hydrolase
MPDLRPSIESPFFVIDQPIRWGDMDAMGHVNNTIYFRYMEQARISMFGAMNVPPDRGGEGPIVINARCDFLKEFRYPDTVRVKTFIGAIGRSSFETLVEMTPAGDEQTVYARGGAKVVWVNFPLQKSASLPASMLDKLKRPFEGVFVL